VDQSVDVGAIEWTAASTCFYDDFIFGVSTPATQNSGMWTLFKTNSGESWTCNAGLSNNSKITFARTVSGAANASCYVRSVPAFSVTSGRYFQANLPAYASSNHYALFLEGDAGNTIHFVISLPSTPRVQVFNAAGTSQSMNNWTTASTINELKVLIVDATHVRLFADGVEYDGGQITVPNLGANIHAGIGVFAIGTGLVTAGTYMDRFDAGMQ
jgi:hypothetical protein